MIHLKRLNTTFITIPKVASRSLKFFLIENCVQSDDIVAPLRLRPTEKVSIQKLTLGPTPREGRGKYYHLNFDGKPYSGHLKLKGIIKHGLSDIDTRFIAIVRNPLDWYLSTLLSTRENKLLHYFDYISFDGRQMSELWTLDYLRMHLIRFCQHHKIDIKYDLQHKHKYIHPVHKKMLDWSFYLKDRKKDLVTNVEKSQDMEIYMQALEKDRKLFGPQ